jgi:flagellar transcriptional activator FlhD
MLEQRDILKINRQLLLLTRQMARDTEAAELMTGLPKTVIEKIATLDMDEIDDLAETVGVSLYTLRLNDPAFTRLLQMPREARSTYAEAAIAGNSRGGSTFP